MGRYRRPLIGLAIVVVVLGIYAAVGFLAVPYYGRKALQDFVQQHYQRTVTIGAIRCNPFTLVVDVTGFSFPDADRQPLITFDRLRVSLQLASIWRLAPSFREIRLEQPYVRAVIRPDGALNLADLGKGFAAAPPPQPQAKAEPVRLYIQRLAVLSGTAAFEDRTRPFHAEFKPIAFELRDFSTTAKTGNDYTLSAASPEGERLSWSGTVHLAPLSSHGVFEIADLQVRTLWRYLRESLRFQIDSGTLAVKGDYDLSSAGGPLALKLNVRDTLLSRLGVKANNAAENCIDVERFEVTDTRVDVARRAVEVAKVQLAGADIKAYLSEQGKLNLLELVSAPTASAPVASAPVAAAPAAPATAAAVPAWTVSAPDIDVSALKLSAQDRQVQPAASLQLEPLSLHVAGFNTAPDDTLDIALDTGVNGSGKVSAKAQFTVKTGALRAHVEAAELPLVALQPYIAHYTSMTLLSGSLGSKLDIERSADGVLAVKGKSRVASLRTVDNALKQDLVKWKELLISDLAYRSKPASLRIGAVTALEPYARMIIAPDRTINISEVLKSPGAVPKTPPPPEQLVSPKELPPEESAAAPRPRTRHGGAAAQQAPAPAGSPTPFPMSVGSVRLVNGSLNYADFWIKPSFALGIQSLAGSITGLSSDPKSRAKVELNGQVERYSPVHIGGAINVLSAALYTDITLSLKDLDLTIVNPYSGHFAGYKIDKGKLSVDVSYKIDQRKLAAQQHFVVDQLELGERVDSPDAAHLPLKIAVALLKDRNGVIDINLPMSGSLDDPSFRLGPIIWKAFVNLIVKAATAPFALLGHLFGGGEHLNVVEFAGGSTQLDPPAQAQLTSLVKALKERPQLKLDVPIVFAPALDRPQLAAAQLQQQLLARVRNSPQGRKHPDTAGELALADPQRHFRLLLEEFQAQLGKDTALPAAAASAAAAKDKEATPYDAAIAELNTALIAHVQIADAELEALGKQRAQAIQQALLADGQVDPGRVFLVNAPPQAGSADKVRVEMAVK